MSAMDTRQPPRFVPTLTDVVPESEAAPAQAVASSPTALPVQLVEDDVPAVQAAEHEEVVSSPAAVLPCAPQSPSQPDELQDWSAMAQSLQTRVMARLDDALEERLRYALADMVQLHSQAMYLAIRQDVENLVSTSVHEAIAQELAHMRKNPQT